MKLGHLVVLAMFAISACGDGNDTPGDKCKASCDDVCPGQAARTPAQITNCETQCDEVQARTVKRDCESEQSALYDCNEQYGCDADFVSRCSSQSKAVNDCYTAYCQTHTSDPDCR